jgi:transposase InsO family protein
VRAGSTTVVDDAFATTIVGWHVSRTVEADFVPDALDQALHARRPIAGGLVHHSDRGVQYVSITYVPVPRSKALNVARRQLRPLHHAVGCRSGVPAGWDRPGPDRSAR